MCRMLGYSHEELIGLHASDIVLESETPNIAPALAQIHASSDHHREWQFRREDGSAFPVDEIGTKMPDGTVLGLIRDLSDRATTSERREGVIFAWPADAAILPV